VIVILKFCPLYFFTGAQFGGKLFLSATSGATATKDDIENLVSSRLNENF